MAWWTDKCSVKAVATFLVGIAIGRLSFPAPSRRCAAFHGDRTPPSRTTRFLMIRITAPALAFTVFWLATAHAELRTNGRAIGCMDASNIPAAEEASQKHDRLKMDMLGCFPIMVGVPARQIDGGNPAIWHVRLKPESPDPMDIWARPSSFDNK